MVEVLQGINIKLFTAVSFFHISMIFSELDFLIQKDRVTNRHNIIPIEAKSGKNYTLSSLRKCMKLYDEYVTSPLVLHSGDFKSEDGILYLPLYMTPLL